MDKTKVDYNKYRKKKLHGLYIDDKIAHTFISWCKKRGSTMSSVLEAMLADFCKRN